MVEAAEHSRLEQGGGCAVSGKNCRPSPRADSRVVRDGLILREKPLPLNAFIDAAMLSPTGLFEGLRFCTINVVEP
jgi:hypothetical protein